MRAGHVVSRPAGTGLAHSFRAGPDGLEYLAYGQREPNDIVYYPDSGKVVLCGRRRDRAHRAARLLGRGGRPGLTGSASTAALDCGHGRCGRCARRRSRRRGGDDPLRQAEARAYRRAGRRRGRAAPGGPGAARASLAALGGARIADALATPGPLVLDAAVYAWAALAALWLVGLPFALLGWRAARRAGLSRQRLPGWFADQAKSLAIGAVIAPLALLGARRRAARRGRTAGGCR